MFALVYIVVSGLPLAITLLQWRVGTLAPLHRIYRKLQRWICRPAI